MVDSGGEILKQVQVALNDDEVTAAIALVEENDVDINYRDVTHDLQTILMKICYIELGVDDLQATLEVMFNQSPDVNIQDSWGRTFLMHACIANKPCIIEALLDYVTTDVTVIDFDGNSALHHAVQNCDVYTLEDILHHNNGPKLLNLYNAKGQSPYTVAEKNGDKQILRLFDSYLNKSIGLQEKRNRKSKHRDVIKLPPTFVSSPRSPRAYKAGCGESQTTISCDFNVKGNNTSRTQAANLKLSLDRRNTSSDGCETAVKCDSAPLTRKWPGREEFMTSLSLSSARLSRHNHKQDSLYSEPLPLNKCLPAMHHLKDSRNSLSSDDEVPERYLRRGRRPSVSLPDLRNVSGSLVSSGYNTPTTDSDFISSSETECSQDDVFSQSFSNELPLNSSRRLKKKVTERQMTLPEIHAGLTTLTSQPNNRKKISPLARQRKYSTSDDQLQKVLLSS